MESAVYIPEPVSDVLRLYDGLIDERAWVRTARQQLELLADRLREGHAARSPGAAVELHNWLPTAGGRLTREVFELPLSPGDAFETVARAHGFSGWEHAIAAAPRTGDPLFEGAVEDILAGDVSALVAALDRTPDLVHRRSHYGHQATLLHYLAANGVEIYRQRVPLNAPEIALLLIEHGADVFATAHMYGKTQTTRGLLTSSSHPLAAGVSDAVLAALDGKGGAT